VGALVQAMLEIEPKLPRVFSKLPLLGLFVFFGLGCLSISYAERLPLPSQDDVKSVGKLFLEVKIARSMQPNAVLRPPNLADSSTGRASFKTAALPITSQTNSAAASGKLFGRDLKPTNQTSNSLEGLIFFSARAGFGASKDHDERKQLSHFFRNVPVPSNCRGIYDYGLEMSSKTRKELGDLISANKTLVQKPNSSNKEELKSRIKESVILDLAGRGRSVEAVYFKKVKSEREIYKVVVLEGTARKVGMVRDKSSTVEAPVHSELESEKS